MQRLVLATLLAGWVSGALAYDFPVLHKVLGGLDGEKGVTLTKECKVSDKIPAIKDKLADTFDLVRKAERQKFDEFLHIRREVPSVQIWASYPQKFAIGPAATGIREQKVLLKVDSSSGKVRAGEEAGKLLKLVNELCKDL